MESQQLAKVIELIKRTGDRCVVLDNKGEDVLVVMNLTDYEKLLEDGSRSLKDLSEDEMIDRVNRDIAAWRACHEDDISELPDLNSGRGWADNGTSASFQKSEEKFIPGEERIASFAESVNGTEENGGLVKDFDEGLDLLSDDEIGALAETDMDKPGEWKVPPLFGGEVLKEDEEDNFLHGDAEDIKEKEEKLSAEEEDRFLLEPV